MCPIAGDATPMIRSKKTKSSDYITTENSPQNIHYIQIKNMCQDVNNIFRKLQMFAKYNTAIFG